MRLRGMACMEGKGFLAFFVAERRKWDRRYNKPESRYVVEAQWFPYPLGPSTDDSVMKKAEKQRRRAPPPPM